MASEAPLAVLKGSDTVAGDEFGSSVAISGTTAVVGAPEAHKGAGRAYVFTKTTTGWKQVAELKGSGTVAFGESVAISGHTILVGAPGTTAFWPTHTRNASAYVFTETADGWKQVERLKGSGRASVAGDFGWSVAVSGPTAVIYAAPNSFFGPGTRQFYGWAYIFANAGGGWKQVARLKQVANQMCDGCDGQNPTYQVAISGTTVLVPSGSSALVLTKTAAGWKQTREITPSPDYGVSQVGLSDATAVVAEGSIGCCGGSLYVFTKTTSGWKQVTETTNSRSGVRSFRYLGEYVAISGRTIVVGAIGGGRHPVDGKAFMLTETGTGWKKVAVLKGSTSGFGWSVAISGTTAIVGDGKANDSDHVYMFHV